MRRAAAIGATAASLAAGALVASDESTCRLVDFYKVAVPATIHYKLVEARCEKLPKLAPSAFPELTDGEQLERYAPLHARYGPPLFDKAWKLGGFYYKNGQKLAANMGGVVPAFYVELFQPFLNNLPARAYAEVRAQVEAELGAPLESVFSHFEPEPLGCASIGQTHRAVLAADGRRVVVKVQNPAAERTFHGDVFALRSLIHIFAPQFEPAFNEIEKQFATEFDYRLEARNGLEVGRNLREARLDVVVPSVHAALTTRRLLVMDEIFPSVPLHTALERQAEAIARARGISKEELAHTERAALEAEAAAARSRGAPLSSAASSRALDVYIGYLRARRWLLKWTLGWFVDVASDTSADPINVARLVDTLLLVHGHEVLIDGCFNADPHPGNVLLISDTRGQRLGLIDYGQVKRLETSERLHLAKGFVLVDAAMHLDPRASTDADADASAHDAEAHARAVASVARHMAASGVRTKSMDPAVLYEMATVYFGRCDLGWIYPRNLVQWSDAMQATDPLEKLDGCEYVVMLNNATLMLLGLGEMLRQPRNLAEMWAPIARRALREADPRMLRETEDEIRAWRHG